MAQLLHNDTNLTFHGLLWMIWIWKTCGLNDRTAQETIGLLKTKFNIRVSLTSQRDNEVCTPKSCDLTPLGFFLWGYVKGNVYKNSP